MMSAMSSSRTRVIPPTTRFVLPSPVESRPGDDLIAIGADLAPGTLLAAYRTGLFPLPVDPSKRRSKLAWYSPDPRGVIPVDGLRTSRSLRRSLRRFRVEFDREFVEVMRSCGDPGRSGRWITDEFVEAYSNLFEMGWANSIVVYDDRGAVVGGLYGVRIDGFFAGESMFHRATDASKVALVHTVDWLRETGGELFDVQWLTPHLESLGATAISRTDYLARLAAAID